VVFLHDIRGLAAEVKLASDTVDLMAVFSWDRVFLLVMPTNLDMKVHMLSHHAFSLWSRHMSCDDKLSRVMDHAGITRGGTMGGGVKHMLD
jgi:hypothetical protein